jgi:hypothetical protein
VNCRLLSALRQVERRARLRAEWTGGGVACRFLITYPGPNDPLDRHPVSTGNAGDTEGQPAAGAHPAGCPLAASGAERRPRTPRSHSFCRVPLTPGRHAAVVSKAGCRIHDHLGQRPAEASSGPVTPNRRDVAPQHADLDITLSDAEGRENVHRAAVLRGRWLDADKDKGRADLGILRA